MEYNLKKNTTNVIIYVTYANTLSKSQKPNLRTLFQYLLLIFKRLEGLKMLIFKRLEGLKIPKINCLYSLPFVYSLF